MSRLTYRTRIDVTEDVDAALSAYAHLFGFAGRTLHARMEVRLRSEPGTTVKAGAFKNAMLLEFGLTGRQFNALASHVEGKREAAVECLTLNIEELTEKVARKRRKLADLKQSLADGHLDTSPTQSKKLTDKGRARLRMMIHQKTRSLTTHEAQLKAMVERLKSGRVKLCFGSQKLYRKQHDLAANGYESHAQWRADWELARNNQFLVLGSKGETSGCQGCVATIADDGSISLRLRLPGALVSAGKYVELHDLRFAYGHEHVLRALAAARMRKLNEAYVRTQVDGTSEKFSEANIDGGVAITWRFVRDAKGWEVMPTIAQFETPRMSNKLAGRLGVDLNADHLAICETDYYGNWRSSVSIPCRTQGLNANQAAAVIGDAVKAVVAHAVDSRKPLVLEKLDFTVKKRALTGANPAHARMLSSFAYNKIGSLVQARAFDAGIEVFFVNPAYTSVIGQVKYSMPLGITTHEAAALAIARRSQKLRERAPRPQAKSRLMVRGEVTAWTVPEWNLPQHRTHPWRCIARSIPRPVKGESARREPAASAILREKSSKSSGAGKAVDPPV